MNWKLRIKSFIYHKTLITSKMLKKLQVLYKNREKKNLMSIFKKKFNITKNDWK